MLEPSQFISEILKSPIFWILGAVIIFSILATFIWPLIKNAFSFAGKIRIAVSPNLQKTAEVKKASKLLTKQTLQVLGVVAVLVILGSVSWFYFQSKPETMSASTFVKREAKSLTYLVENEIYDIILYSDLYLIDLRSDEHFRDKHIKGSFNIPMSEFREGVNLPENKRVAVYYTTDNFEDAAEASDVINKQIEAKVYLIEDGYEGMVNQGLKTESGQVFGGEFFSF